jgi:YVTN family beta-propeller protein
MTRIHRAFVAVCLLAGCQSIAPQIRPPLEGEGELYVYLQPLSPEAGRLGLTVDSVAVRRPNAASLPLTLARESPIAASDGQHLLASGRLPPEPFSGLEVHLKNATLARPDGAANLLVAQAAATVDIALTVEPGRGRVIWLTLDLARSLRGGVEFTPAFTATFPPPPVVGLLAYATSAPAGTVTVLDENARQVTAVLEPGGEPRGVAISAPNLQVFVARAALDDVAVIDLPSGAALGRIRLRAGDRPGELALTPNGSLLLALNSGSSSLSFIDPVAQVELDRVAVGRDPSFLLLDREGKTAYVCNRLTGTVTIVDLPTRVVTGTLVTETDPVAVQLNRAENRLYVAHGLSPFLNAYSLPDLRLLSRVLVGAGATALRVDPRTDLIYLGRTGSPQLEVYEPSALIRVGNADADGTGSYAAIDDLRNTLWVLVPEREGIAVIDLFNRKPVPGADVAGPPTRLSLSGERQ